MKTKLLLFSIVLVFPLIIRAQTENPIPELFKIESDNQSKSTQLSNSKSKGKSSKFLKRENNPMTYEIRKITFPNLKKIADQNKFNKKSPSYFQFSIPKGKKKATGKILAVPKHIEVDDDGNYTYNAELLYEEDIQGDLTLIHQDGKNFGSFTIGDRTFKIEHLDEEGEYLIELDKEKLNKSICPAEGYKSDNKSSKIGLTKDINKLFSAINSTSGSSTIRVLTLYTDDGAAVSSPSQFAATAIAEANQALRNSKISSQLSFVNVGVARLENLDDTRDAFVDNQTAQTNSEIINLRNQFGADLVVVLIDRNYTSNNSIILGVAPLLDFGDPDTAYVAFTEADSNTGVYVHEMGHMFGCRHDQEFINGFIPINVDNMIPPNLSVTAKGHQWFRRDCFFCGKRFRKSIVANGQTEGFVRLFFSNPNVTEESKSRGATGTSTRNNAQQMINAGPVVSQYNDFEPLSVRIDGPSDVLAGDSFTLSANVQNCSGSASYRWERSDNGFSYFQVGTSRTLTTNTNLLDGFQIFFRLRVTCNGQTVTTTRVVFVFGGDGGFFFEKEPTEELENEITETSLTNSSSIAYPNPAASELNLVLSSTTKQEISVKLFGIAPFSYEKRFLKSTIKQGENQLKLNVSEVPQGIYELMVYSSNSLLYKQRILISR